MRISRIATSSFAALLLVALGSSALAATRTLHSYAEDFSTREFRDSVWTSAEWDTVARSLHLADFPALIGEWNSPGSALGVDVDGDYVFLADGTYGLQILDVIAPDSPVLRGSYNTPGNANDVDVEDDYAYVADGTRGLRAVDISDPAAPVAAGVYDTPGTAYAVDVDGDLAYVADGSGGLIVVSITDPLNLSLVGSAATAGQAYDVDVEGDYAYVAAYDAGLVVIDISDPARPVVRGAADTPGLASGVEVDGDHAYVADDTGGLVVMDVSSPATPAIIASLDTEDRARDVAVDGQWAYVADSFGGVHVIDIHDPGFPLLYQSCNSPGDARAVGLAGLTAYVADYSNGLRVLRIGVPHAPIPSDPVPVPVAAQDVEIAGKDAFVADDSGLRVFNLSDPAHPVETGFCDLLHASEVDVAGNYAYVADYFNGLQVIDITHPANPVIVANYPTTTFFLAATIEGNYVYASREEAGGGGIVVIDVSDPRSPTFAGFLSMPSYVWHVEVDGNRAYAARSSAGVSVVDITDPTAPFLLRTVDTPGTAWGVCASGDYVYVADGDAGVQVIDVRNPAAPVIVATCDTPGSARQVTISGDLAYVADGESGFQIIDISDPLHPAIIGSFGTLDGNYAVAVAGDYAYLGLALGFQAIQVSTRDASAVLGNHARSLAVNQHPDTILRVRASTVQSGDISWEVNAVDPGSPWQSIVPDDTWLGLTLPGDQLKWRCSLEAGMPEPVCSGIALSWLYASAIIDSVRDMPEDQGGWLRLAFQRSGHDFAGDPGIIASYHIWRRMDDDARRAEVAREAVPGDAPGMMRTPDGGLFFMPPDGQTLGFPPGMWESVGSLPPLQQQRYFTAVPSRGDSTPEGVRYSVYCVTAHTTNPAVWFASPADSAYSLDNMAPSPPAGLHYQGPAVLAWDACPEGDFDYFTVYGSAVDTLGSSAVLIGYTAGTTLDVSAQPHAYYHVTATDFAGNEGGAASIGGTTGVAAGGGVPITWSLRSIRPNPGHGRMEVLYDVPRSGEVRLDVFDVKGRAVSTLVAATMPVGRHRVIWEADAGGSHLSPGIYFVQMQAPGYSERRKVVLLPSP